METQIILMGKQKPTDAGKDGETVQTPMTPPPLLRQRDWVFQTAILWMRTYGVCFAKLQTTISGAIPVLSMGIEEFPYADRLPDALREARPDIMRALQFIFARYCINSLRIKLNDAEQDELLTYWEYLATGDQEAADKLRYNRVPLQFETDPQAADKATDEEQPADEQKAPATIPAPEFES